MRTVRNECAVQTQTNDGFDIMTTAFYMLPSFCTLRLNRAGKGEHSSDCDEFLTERTAVMKTIFRKVFSATRFQEKWFQ